jgi:hypothetical protein
MFRSFGFLVPKDFKIIWLSNILALNVFVPDEDYNRNPLCALDLIPTLLSILFEFCMCVSFLFLLKYTVHRSVIVFMDIRRFSKITVKSTTQFYWLPLEIWNKNNIKKLYWHMSICCFCINPLHWLRIRKFAIVICLSSCCVNSWALSRKSLYWAQALQ